VGLKGVKQGGLSERVHHRNQVEFYRRRPKRRSQIARQLRRQSGFVEPTTPGVGAVRQGTTARKCGAQTLSI